jgi:hypothetical protein
MYVLPHPEIVQECPRRFWGADEAIGCCKQNDVVTPHLHGWGWFEATQGATKKQRCEFAVWCWCERAEQVLLRGA